MAHPSPADDPVTRLLAALRASPRGRRALDHGRDWVIGVVRATLTERTAPLDDTRAALLDGWRALPTLDRATARALHRLDRRPWSASMTVHAAHDRDPRVAALFARRGLPRCEACAVGADETLEEAAFGEGFDLAGLLTDLNSLT